MLVLIEQDTTDDEDAPLVTDGYGSCSNCSCPGFSGSSYTCSRGGCGHHYDQHW